MALEITLKPDKTELRVQEDTLVRVVLRNGGGSPIEVVNPIQSVAWPVFKLLSKQSGVTETHRRKPSSPLTSEIPMTLEAGKQFEWSFWLRQVLEIARPGEYELTAEYEWNAGAGIARSAPVGLKLEASNVRWAALGNCQSPTQEEFFVFWVEAGGQLLRTTVSNYDDPQVTETAALDKVDPSITPWPSISANKGNPMIAWLTWLEGGAQNPALKFRFVGLRQTEGKIFSMEMPRATIRIVPNPFMLDSQDGEVLLWMATAQPETAKLQLAVLERSGNCRPGAFLKLSSAAQPLWMQTAFPSGGERRAYLASREGESVRLKVTTWKAGGEMTELKELASLPGRFVGAGLAVMPDDTTSGMLLSRPDDRPNTILMMPWGHKLDGTFRSGEPTSVAFEDAGRIDAAKVRVNVNYGVSVALKVTGQPWRLRAPGEDFKPIGGDAGQTLEPFYLFFNSLVEPLVLYSRPGMGFFFSTPSGAEASITQRG